MEQQKQKYPTFVVLIVILILAFFIIVPPVTRAFFPKEEVVENVEEGDDNNITDGTLVCSKDYPTTTLSIVSNANYSNGKITTNIITFSNPNNLSDVATITIPDGQKEFTDYSAFFGLFSGLSTDFVTYSAGITVVTINDSLLATIENNEEIVKQFGEASELKSYYEAKGFTCIVE